MDVTGFTRSNLQDTIRRCKEALWLLDKAEEQRGKERAEETKCIIFSKLLLSFPDPEKDEDELYEALRDEMKKQDHWKMITYDGVECTNDDCWYDDENPGRKEEYKYSYLAVFREDRVVLCDVCCDNVSEEGFTMPDIVSDFWEWHRNRSVKRLKSE